MLRLYILRHAKSSWADPGNTDFERTLNSRGVKDLKKIASIMVKQNYLPDQIYCSPATRTRETIAGIEKHIKSANQETHFAITHINELYSGSREDYLNILHNHQNNDQSIMIVGHNPNCEGLAFKLVSDGETEALETLAYKYPAGALAIIEFTVDSWNEITDDTGYLLDFIIPREL